MELQLLPQDHIAIPEALVLRKLRLEEIGALVVWIALGKLGNELGDRMSEPQFKEVSRQLRDIGVLSLKVGNGAATVGVDLDRVPT